MIRIQRGTPPDVLVENGQSWTDELMQDLSDGGTVNGVKVSQRYGHPDVRAALRRDALRKCMYCEGRVEPVAFGHVEHYRPKATFPERTFEWANLGWSCPQCNVAKRDTFDEAYPPIDPYSEDPSSFITAEGPFIYPHPGNTRGRITIDLLKLNRAGLIEDRARVINTLVQLCEDAIAESQPSLHDLKVRGIQELARNDSPFSLVAAEVLNRYGIPLP